MTDSHAKYLVKLIVKTKEKVDEVELLDWIASQASGLQNPELLEKLGVYSVSTFELPEKQEN